MIRKSALLMGLYFILLALIMAAKLMAASGPYPCEDNLIEIMFLQESQVRLRGGQPVDLKSDALAGVERVLAEAGPVEWLRISSVSEERLDQLQMQGVARSGRSLYNLNNIYRLRVPRGLDIWQLAADLEALPGVMLARPVPRPTALPNPVPPNYQPQQNYQDPAAATPTGIDAEYAWTQSGGDGSGVTVCDLEYGWYYSHADILKLNSGSQLNPEPLSLPVGETDDHGTAVVGILAADDNGWGTTGICYGANIKTCGTYYGSSPSWNVPGALTYALDSLSAGDVILLENQWDYSDPGTAHPDFIPIEWWLNYHPNSQSFNGVYAAIQTAVANGIHVVEAGGNGGATHTYVGIDTDNLTWYGNSGAIIVGAGGAYPGGTRPSAPEGDLQRVDYSSYGSRFDLQAWGEDVVTTGYNDLYSAEGKNYWYTGQFAGTSSASPIVAGAIACCVGRWTASGYPASALTPSMLRDILVTTGTAQVTPPSGHIGPRPDLQAAFQQLVLEWTDVTTPSLAMATDHSIGGAWADFDNDGDDDLYVSNSMEANKMLSNISGVLTDTPCGAAANSGRANGTVIADYDNDGLLDIYIAKSTEANQLFHNDGGFAFSDSSSSPINDAGNNAGAAWGDYDRDGGVDLYVSLNNGANSLYHNDGGGTFADVTSGPLADAGSAIGCSWADYDNDGDLDLYICNYNGEANKLLRNDPGSFTDVTSGPLGNVGNGMSGVWGDYDNDGDLDLYIANAGFDSNRLLRNDGGTFVDVTSGLLGDLNVTYAASWADYDNDGDLDLYIGNAGSANKLLRNDGGGTFSDATKSGLDDANTTMGAIWGDWDQDGDVDLYLLTYGASNKLFRNEVGDNNHWLQVKAVGTISNTASIGARVRIVAGGQQQIREISASGQPYGQNSLIAAFGLGSTMQVDTVEVSWPSDTVRIQTSVAADQLLTIYETSQYVCGDADGNGIVNVSDAVYEISYIFGGGPPPNPLLSGDADCNGIVNVSDAVYLIAYIFGGGPAPCDPSGDGVPDC